MPASNITDPSHNGGAPINAINANVKVKAKANRPSSLPPSEPSEVYEPSSSSHSIDHRHKPNGVDADEDGTEDDDDDDDDDEGSGRAYTYPHPSVYQIFKRTPRGTYAVFTLDSSSSSPSSPSDNGNVKNMGNKLAGLSPDALTALVDCLQGMNAVEEEERGGGMGFVWVVTSVSVSGENLGVGMKRERVGR